MYTHAEHITHETLIILLFHHLDFLDHFPLVTKTIQRGKLVAEINLCRFAHAENGFLTFLVVMRIDQHVQCTVQVVSSVRNSVFFLVFVLPLLLCVWC